MFNELEFLQSNLPKGWTAEPYNQFSVIISQPGVHGGMMTLDFRQRMISTGMGRPTGVSRLPLIFNGRVWKLRMVDAAVEHLRSIYDEREESNV